MVNWRLKDAQVRVRLSLFGVQRSGITPRLPTVGEKCERRTFSIKPHHARAVQRTGKERVEARDSKRFTANILHADGDQQKWMIRGQGKLNRDRQCLYPRFDSRNNRFQFAVRRLAPALKNIRAIEPAAPVPSSHPAKMCFVQFIESKITVEPRAFYRRRFTFLREKTPR